MPKSRNRKKRNPKQQMGLKFKTEARKAPSKKTQRKRFISIIEDMKHPIHVSQEFYKKIMSLKQKAG